MGNRRFVWLGGAQVGPSSPCHRNPGADQRLPKMSSQELSYAFHQGNRTIDLEEGPERRRRESVFAKHCCTLMPLCPKAGDRASAASRVPRVATVGGYRSNGSFYWVDRRA